MFAGYVVCFVYLFIFSLFIIFSFFNVVYHTLVNKDEQNAEICRSRQPHSRLTPPPRGTCMNIRINLIPPETTTVIGLHFAADSMGLSSLKSCGGLRMTQQSVYRLFKVIQGR